MRPNPSNFIRSTRIFGLVVGLGLIASLPSIAVAEAGAIPGYLSSPDLHGSRVVFSAEGDLWLSHVDGSDVRRLTSHPGSERGARFSPDGNWIAFTGSYDGNSDLFVIAVSGGEPKRLTWHPWSDNCVNWTPDGERIIFSNRSESVHYNPELYSVPFRGGDFEKLPLGRANFIDIDPASGRYAFTRLGGGGTWKRYRGGTAPEIWMGDPAKEDYREVTDFDGPDLNPMWHDERIYFLSDKGGTVNIWSMKASGSDRKRHTEFDRWDVRQVGMGSDGRLVFTLAGDVHLYDPATDQEHKLPIDLPSERTLTRTRYPNPSRYVTEYSLAPDGERIVVAARGELFTIPLEDGVSLPITRGSGAKENRVIFHPEGKRLLYVSDDTGEEAFVTADAWGRGKQEIVKPAGPGSIHFQPLYSPDGEWLAFADQTHTLYIMPAEGGDVRKIDYCQASEISDYRWSPDSRWLAYSKNNSVYFASLYIYDVQEETIHQITDEYTDDYNPSWDPDGRYLYFLSARTVNPMIGGVDFETININSARPYMFLLREDVDNPFADLAGIPPAEDEDDDEDDDESDDKDADSDDDADDDGKSDADSDKNKEDDEDDEGDDDEDKDDDKPEPIEIEFDGLAGRYLELPVAPGSYRSLSATSSKLFYMSSPIRGMNEEDRGDGPSATLMVFDLEEEEASTFVSGVASYQLSVKADKIAFSQGRGQLFVVATDAPPGDLSEAGVSLGGIVIELDPQDEWRQIYYEGWRQMRDWYWDEEMHGLDWEAVRDQYAEMLPRLATRADLNDLLAEMIGELSTGHTYVGGGDPGRKGENRSTGLLGAQVERHNEVFRVSRIYHGDEADRVRSPLSVPGVDVSEGDYIFEVNLRGFSPDQPFDASLDNQVGRPVMLTVNDTLDIATARHVVVTPMGSDYRLRYVDWVRRNREYVAEQTDGKIGYIHVPDMDTAGLVEFDRWFYPQLNKEGLVVDMRWNGGGYISQLIVARLQRSIISWDKTRHGGATTYPNRVLNGPFVVLTNENAGSDGDIFPAAVQLAKLAPVIGKRSWGGVVGIRGFKPLVDGGFLTYPEFAWWDKQRGWGLEGSGVKPDIEVDNLPQDLAKGIDAQLNRGINEVMKLSRKQRPEAPEFGPAPDRSRKAYESEL
jgi:tricorn protease